MYRRNGQVFSDRPASPTTTKRLDVVLTTLGIVGLILFLAFYDRAFPSAALDLELSRDQIAERANGYMDALGYDLDGYEFALTFGEAWMSSVYLQHTLGIPQTNDLARKEELPLWLWEARWFVPLQKEGFYLSLMPDGTVVAVTHTLLEDVAGAALSEDEARVLAEAYLVEDRGWDLGGWESVSASTEARPGGRVDHHFVWRRADWDVGKSELRLAVDVQGDNVGGYGYWLKVPEAFLRRFSEQRNRAGFINQLSYYLGAGGFGAVALVYYLVGQRRGIYPWREGLWVGACVAGVDLMASLNYLPLHKAWYDTTQGYAVFWIEQLIGILFSALYVGVMVAVLWVGGRYLARRVWVRQDKVLPRTGDRWIALSRSAWRGLMLGAVHAGYVVLFYFVATQILGGWMPMDVPAVNLYATPLPFLAPLATGVIPAISEELLFRLVGIGIVLAIARKRWLAVLVPGVLWAFAHLAYVRDPIYMRGVELTVVALLYGVVFLRFDLTTVIVAHLTYNAGITAFPLLRSQHPYFVTNGVVVFVGLLVPVLPGAVRALRRRFGGTLAEPSPTVKRAVEEDIPGLSGLVEGDVDWSAWIQRPSTVVLCLCIQDRIIGVAVGKVGLDGVGRVPVLFVAPEWRRRYWASRLAQALSEALREQGVRSVRVTVPADDWALARFWDAQGWLSWATVYARRLEPSPGGGLPALVTRVKRWARATMERKRRQR